MLRSLALLAVVATTPAWADELTLSEARPTHGILGPTRTDKRVLPGDSVFVAFNIEGLKVDAMGKMRYSTDIEVTDGAGKKIFGQKGKPQEVINSLGGNQVPAHAQLDIGLNQPPGEYTVTVTVNDLAGGKSKSVSHKCTVQPKAFSLVRVTTSGDPQGVVPSGLLGPGQSLYVNAFAVDFARDASKQPKLAFECRILDEAGKPTLPAPLMGTIEKDVAADAKAVPLQFLVSLNRPGKFTIELKATDKVSGKTDTRTFPITVHAP